MSLICSYVFVARSSTSLYFSFLQMKIRAWRGCCWCLVHIPLAFPVWKYTDPVTSASTCDSAWGPSLTAGACSAWAGAGQKCGELVPWEETLPEDWWELVEQAFSFLFSQVCSMPPPRGPHQDCMWVTHSIRNLFGNTHPYWLPFLPCLASQLS